MSRLCSKRTLRGSAATVIVAAFMLLGVQSAANAQSAAVVSVTTDVDNITNSGVIDATAPGSIGLWAEAQAGTSCGSNIVNVTGNITADYWAIIAIGCGSSTVNVESGQTVTSATPGTVTLWNIATTTATINIDGTVAAPSDDEIALVQFGTSSVTTLNASAVLRGRFIGGDGTDELIINAGATWFTAGESDFWTGSDLLNNAGTINLTGNATFLGLEEFTNSGTLTLGGRILTLPDLVAFVNSGTIVLGTGTLVLPELATFTNSGTLILGADPLSPLISPLHAQSASAVIPTATFTIGSTLTNSGTVSLANQRAGDLLTITKGYDGIGNAALVIDAGDAISDRLIIGGSATGSTRLFVNQVGAIDSDRILVIDSEDAASGAFELANPDVTQLIGLHLEQSGSSFFLYAMPNDIAFQPLAIGNVTRDMWYQSADVLAAYTQLRRSDLGNSRKGGLGLWGQFFWNRGEYGDRQNVSIFDTDIVLDNKVETDHRGAQAGIDYLVSDSFVVGVTGGYQQADADFRSTPGEIDAEGFNLGAYAQFGNSTGLYGEVLAKMDWSDVHLTNGAFELSDGNPDSRNWGIGGEVGYRWTSGSVNFDVGGGLAHVRMKIDDFSSEGVDYDFESNTSLRGKLGARIEFGGKLAPFVDAKLFHEFDGDARLTLANGDDRDLVEGNGLGTWARMEAGIGARNGRSVMLSGWAEFGDVRGIGVRAGFRF